MYQAFEAHDVSVVIDQEGILRYKGGGVNVNEIRTVIDGLLTIAGDNKGVVNQKIPNDYSLNQNYPNPFNPSTKISFSIPEQSLVTLEVYSLLGKKVTNLVKSSMKVGTHEVIFNAQHLPAGIYFYKMNAGKYSAVKKMTLVK
jgi:hypothetical protein